MQTLKLLIPGSYYDSQIYSGRLYLWDTDGSIITINWDKLIEDIEVPEHLRLAMHCAFRQSEYLYGDHWKLIFQDKEIRSVIQNKFQELATTPIELSTEDIEDHVIRAQDNPFMFPHADTVIYSSNLYVGSKSGVDVSSCNLKAKTPINPRPSRLLDLPTLGIAASYSTLALAAGSDGAFEYPLSTDFSDFSKELYPLKGKQHSNSVRWMYASVFSSSYFGDGYLADFTLEGEKEKTIRVLRNVVPSDDLILYHQQNGGTKFSWGLHDKICLAVNGSIEVVQYNPRKSERERFVSLGEVEISDLQGDIINADSALFGFIIESEDGLLVINSLQETIWIEGEPVNWRVFPRSKFYENQMHIIYEDHLCIHSFNHDYFVNQDMKRIGIRHKKDFPNKRFR